MSASGVAYRWLLHVDLDQFQVSVERRRRDELNGVAVIVGGDGDPTRARQVVTCASYEARALGVRAGMPMRAAAKKAPDAVFLPLDMAVYEAASAEVMAVVRTAGDAIEVWGWDEGYVGIEPTSQSAALTRDDVVERAHELRRSVESATGLQCCVGISDNKQRAKAATGFAKAAVRVEDSQPSERVFVLDADNWGELMDHRPCRDLWSVGSRTAKKLTEAGVDTVAQLVAVPRDDLVAMFGPHQGNWLYVLCRGGGDNVISTEPWIAKSHSKARTYDADLTDRDELHSAVADLTREVLDQVVAEERTPFRVGVTARTSTFYTRTKMRKLPEPTIDYAAIVAVAGDLLDSFDLDRPIRLLSVRLELLPPEE